MIFCIFFTKVLNEKTADFFLIGCEKNILGFLNCHFFIEGTTKKVPIYNANQTNSKKNFCFNEQKKYF
jgi:hypothetical protein